MSNISKKTYVWVLLAMAVIMGSGLLYSANARAGEIVKTEKNGDEGTFPWQNEFTTTALNYESDTQKETEKTTQKVTTQQKEETNVTTVVISDEKCVNATIKRAKIKKIKKKASNISFDRHLVNDKVLLLYFFGLKNPVVNDKRIEKLLKERVDPIFDIILKKFSILKA